MKTYTTAQGDMWDSIAYTQLGGTAYTGELICANAQYRNFYIFPAGIVLVLPEIRTAAASPLLPPWKRRKGNLS